MAWTRFRRRGATLAALVAALLVVVPLAASVQAAPAARAQSPQVLRVALVQEIDRLMNGAMGRLRDAPPHPPYSPENCLSRHRKHSRSRSDERQNPWS